MSIDIKTDVVGTNIDIDGSVGDVFGEALFTVGQVAESFKGMNQFVFDAFNAYVKYVLDAIALDGKEGEESFDFSEFSSNVLRLIRSDPDNAEELYNNFIANGGDDSTYTFVLLAMPSKFVVKEPEEEEEDKEE